MSAPTPCRAGLGAGGLGLEIINTFRLFGYREVLALILVLLAQVAVVNSSVGA